METEKKVISKMIKLKPSQAIALFIKVNKEPITRLDQNTFGAKYESACYACSATNALLSLCGVTEEKAVQEAIEQRESFLNLRGNDCQEYFDKYTKKATLDGGQIMHNFELSIDFLRRGDLLRFLSCFPYILHRNIEVKYLGRKSTTTKSITKKNNVIAITDSALPFISNAEPLNPFSISRFNDVKTLLEKVKL